MHSFCRVAAESVPFGIWSVWRGWFCLGAAGEEGSRSSEDMVAAIVNALIIT